MANLYQASWQEVDQMIAGEKDTSAITDNESKGVNKKKRKRRKPKKRSRKAEVQDVLRDDDDKKSCPSVDNISF